MRGKAGGSARFWIMTTVASNCRKLSATSCQRPHLPLPIIPPPSTRPLMAGVARLITSFCDQATQDLYLPRLLSGEWQGTMALTEPQAGSSLADITLTGEPTAQGALLDERAEDIHLCRRSRRGGECGPYGPGAGQGCAVGHPGHFAVCCSEETDRSRWESRCK